MLLNSNEKITVYTPLKQTAKARLELIRVKYFSVTVVISRVCNPD